MPEGYRRPQHHERVQLVEQMKRRAAERDALAVVRRFSKKLPAKRLLANVRCPRCNGHGRPRIVALARQVPI
jgi:hypothetical protein